MRGGEGDMEETGWKKNRREMQKRGKKKRETSHSFILKVRGSSRPFCYFHKEPTATTLSRPLRSLYSEWEVFYMMFLWIGRE